VILWQYKYMNTIELTIAPNENSYELALITPLSDCNNCYVIRQVICQKNLEIEHLAGENDNLQKQLAETAAKNERLKALLRRRNSALFGRSAEKLSPVPEIHEQAHSKELLKDITTRFGKRGARPGHKGHGPGQIGTGHKGHGSKAGSGIEGIRPALAEAQSVGKRLKKNWLELTVFVDHPRIPMDNNLAERILRPAALGRKNYYGTHSEWSGRFTAMCMSILQTAGHHG